MQQPGIRRIVDIAARKGVSLDIQTLPRFTRNAQQAALAPEIDPAQMARALVYVVPKRDRRPVPIVCLISGRNQVDPALLVAVTGEVDIRPASAPEVRELTGCQMGSVVPFGHGRDVRVFMDQDLCAHQWIWSAAGTDSAIFRVAPRTLRMLANAVVAPLTTTGCMSARRACLEAATPPSH
jgi:prolyl-tRNA editing enzyme YbaK/EbsC (Cys-tRNA(Pro) deacylase)